MMVRQKDEWRKQEARRRTETHQEEKHEEKKEKNDDKEDEGQHGKTEELWRTCKTLIKRTSEEKQKKEED